MRKIFIVIFLTIGLTLTFLNPAVQAKWWIFGSSEDEISTSYLYLNKTPYDEMGQKVTLYREMLQGGVVTISGKAALRRGKVGSVRVSVDGKENWKEASLSENGAFEFSFRPEIGNRYRVFIEIMSTAGKTNDVESTFREVTVSDQAIQPLIRDVLDKLIAAYRNEDPNRFMALVSENFAGDKVNLDRAIRQDFSKFDNIDLRYTLNNISTDSRGMIFVALSYTRHLIWTPTGRLLKDGGATEFVFTPGDKGPLVYSMKWPLIFGVMDRENVATGEATPVANEQVLVVSASGEAAVFPYEQARRIIGGGTATEQARSVTLHWNAFDNFESLSFAEGDRVAETNLGSLIGDVALTPEGQMIFMHLRNGVLVKDLGVISLDQVTTAPEDGYLGQGGAASPGHSYAFKLPNNTYGAIEITAMTGNPGGGTVTIRFKYQPQSGSRQF